MFELEVYAAGLGDLNKILELDYRLSAIPGLRYSCWVWETVNGDK